jgi:D-sedoheptulose 7-phosphate isomerase
MSGGLGEFVLDYFARLRELVERIPVERVEAVGEILYGAYRHDKQVFIVGNGGSASTASHMACDLGKNTIGANRPRFRVLSLNDNIPLVTALANDLGYDRVFSEQLVNLIRPGDVLLVISGSGNSANVVNALRYARDRGATTIALLGFDGGEALSLADEHVLVPDDDYGRVEDVHLILNHAITAYFRRRLDEEEPPRR